MSDETTASTGMGAIGWMRSVVIDAHDPRRLAEFWCGVLDVEIVEEESDWVQLSPDPGGTFMAFQPTDAPRPTSMVARPDIEVTDIDSGTGPGDRARRQLRPDDPGAEGRPPLRDGRSRGQRVLPGPAAPARSWHVQRWGDRRR